MTLLKIEINHLRNIVTAQLTPKQFNIITGLNASGKTSLLEAIYCLSRGKSFRSGKIKTLIQQQQQQFSIIGLINHQSHQYHLGIERNLSELKIKINGQWAKNTAELAEQFAVQIINPESHEILTQGPLPRRQLIDWGVFYNEPKFISVWKQFQKILKQRNQALKQHQSNQQIQIWDPQFIKTSELLFEYRNIYITQLQPYINQYINELMEIDKIDIEFYQGWSSEKTLSESLSASLEKDQVAGYTRYGPHRYDILIKTNKTLAQYFLSRGQQKLLICAIRLAQARLFREANQQKCVLLIDDLPSELDESRRETLMKLLLELDMQVFITTTDKSLLPHHLWTDFAMFHVKHGEIVTL